MSDLVENQVQLLLTGQALENDDICNIHTLASDTTGMSNAFARQSRFHNVLVRCRILFSLAKRKI